MVRGFDSANDVARSCELKLETVAVLKLLTRVVFKKRSKNSK